MVAAKHRRRAKPARPGPARSAAGSLGALVAADPAYRGCDSEIEVMLVSRLQRAGLPLGEPQWRFVPGRQFRWDRCWPDRMLACEVNGGTWTTTGAHSRGSGIERDALKLSLGAALGWRVIVATRDLIESGQAVELIRQALGVEPVRGPG